jgi:hypothetical protein
VRIATRRKVSLSTVISEALSEGLRLHAATERSGRILKAYEKLVEAYERARYPIDPPDPLHAIRFRLQQQGSDWHALIGVIGNRHPRLRSYERRPPIVVEHDSPPAPEAWYSCGYSDPSQRQAEKTGGLIFRPGLARWYNRGQ